MSVQRYIPTDTIELIRGSLLLMVGVVGVLLLVLGWILQTGRLAGFLAVYGIAISVIGFGAWGVIAVIRRYF